MPNPFALGPTNSVDLIDGRFRGADDAARAAARQALHDAIAAIQARPASEPLVVHFHGGLVSKKSATKMAEGLGPIYQSGGAFPFFFVWNSHVHTTLFHSLDEIGAEPAFKRILKKVAQWVASKLGSDLLPDDAKGVTLDAIAETDLPTAEEDLAELLDQQGRALDGGSVTNLTGLQQRQIQKDLDADPELRALSSAIASGIPQGAEMVEAPSRGFGGRLSTTTRMSPRVLGELAGARADGEKSLGVLLFLAKHALAITVRVVKRFVDKRDHGVYTTIVEEIVRELYLDNAGQLLWSMMKRDTLDAFADGGGGDAFVDTIAAKWASGRRLVLVGHSTGAIYITHLLAALRANAPAFAPPPEVVFLAPAISFDLLAAHAPDYEALGARVRTFALKDEIERSYWEVPLLYKGSLLYMVSGIAEEEVDAPLVGMERHWSERYASASQTAVAELIAPEQRIWSKTGTASALGLRVDAAKHGDFDDDATCRASLVEILKKGL
ncbi:MAG: hypothetical protein AB7S26_13245 [Sandaracinaceae bacterium]